MNLRVAKITAFTLGLALTSTVLADDERHIPARPGSFQPKAVSAECQAKTDALKSIRAKTIDIRNRVDSRLDSKGVFDSGLYNERGEKFAFAISVVCNQLRELRDGAMLMEADDEAIDQIVDSSSARTVEIFEKIYYSRKPSRDRRFIEELKNLQTTFEQSLVHMEEDWIEARMDAARLCGRLQDIKRRKTLVDGALGAIASRCR